MTGDPYRGVGLYAGGTCPQYRFTPIGHNLTDIHACNVSTVSTRVLLPPVLAEAAAVAFSAFALLLPVLAEAAAAAFSACALLLPELAEAACAYLFIHLSICLSIYPSIFFLTNLPSHVHA